jgi:DNA-binding response OmpR family regulator
MSHILILDDDPSLRTVLADYLRGRGHTIQCFENTESALEEMSRCRIDIAIIDLFLPGSDGLDVIEHARSAHPEAKIIAISGGSKIDAQACLRCARDVGANVGLEKPFSLLELNETIDLLLSPSRPPANSDVNYG